MNVALLLSGGTGTRMGANIPKQYMEVQKKPIIIYSMETFFSHERVDAVQIVADEAWREKISGWLKPVDRNGKFLGFSIPGETRQLSIWNGIKDVRNYAGEEDMVIIHDVARPLVSERLISRCLDAAMGRDGALPVLPMKDTVYLSKDGKSVTGLLNRNEIFAGQAPEVFKLGKYYEANKNLLPERIKEISGSSQPAIVYAMDIDMVPGEEENFKITAMEDLNRFCEILKARECLIKVKDMGELDL